MKKNYQSPAMRVVRIQQRYYMLLGSQVNKVNGVFNYGGGGTGTARSRGDNGLDEDDSDYDF